MSNTASQALPIEEVLAGLGYRDAGAQSAARVALEAAGLTNPRKKRISAAKLEAVRASLAEAFVIACSRAACRSAVAADPRTVIDASLAGDCNICGGQQNRSEMARAVDALVERGLARVVVVGGSPATHGELRALAGERLALRLIPGTERRNARDARADLAWADLVVVWGGTELDHKVSKLYTDARAEHVVTCARRGVAALAATMAEAAARRGAGGQG